MARQTMTSEQFEDIRREAGEIEQLRKSPGWKLIEEDIRSQMEQIASLLAENRLRTVEESVQTKTGTKTYITTAETQIAENSGMYKAYQRIFTLLDTVQGAPSRVLELEKQGKLFIDKSQDEQKKGEVKE